MWRAKNDGMARIVEGTGILDLPRSLPRPSGHATRDNMMSESLQEQCEDELIELCTNMFNAGLSHEDILDALEQVVDRVRAAKREDEQTVG